MTARPHCSTLLGTQTVQNPQHYVTAIQILCVMGLTIETKFNQPAHQHNNFYVCSVAFEVVKEKKRSREKFIFVIVKSCSAVTVLLDENTIEAGTGRRWQGRQNFSRRAKNENRKFGWACVLGDGGGAVYKTTKSL